MSLVVVSRRLAKSKTGRAAGSTARDSSATPATRMPIFVLHGIVESPVPGACSYRSYVGRDAFETYVRQRAVPFGRWTASGPQGDVLTVDDATRAGADACWAARRLGCEVLFFVNPYQVAGGEPYFFAQLDALLDARTATAATYAGARYDLTDPTGLRALRLAIRAALMVEPATQSQAAIPQLAALLGVARVELAPHQQTISAAELVALRDAGVRIENHGWSHVEIAALDDAQLIAHVVAGRDWLRRELAVDAGLYAVPFGDTDVPARLHEWVAGGYFLASDRFPRGRCGPLAWNRRDLGVEIRASRRISAYVTARNAGGGTV
jgi:hypothetical protein